MALGDIDRFGALAGAQDCGYRLATVCERRPGAGLGSGLLRDTHENRFAAADARAVQEHAKVACNAEPPRVRIAVAIVENQVGRMPQFAEGTQEHGNFPKAKQSGNVGERQAAFGAASFELHHVGKAVDDHAGNGDIPLQIERDVGACDSPDLGKPIEGLEPAAQLELNLRRLARRDIPRMQSQSLHARTLIGQTKQCQAAWCCALHAREAKVSGPVPCVVLSGTGKAGFRTRLMPGDGYSEPRVRNLPRGIWPIGVIIRQRSQLGDWAQADSTGILSEQFAAQRGQQMGLQISSRTESGVTVLDVRGRATLGPGNDALSAELRKVVGNDAAKVLVNLAGVTQIDSSGISTIVRSFVTLERGGGKLALLKPTGHVRDVLELTRLIQSIPTYDDESTALASLG